jgi:hypothetical protein
VFRRGLFASRGAVEPRGCRLQREWAPIAARLRAVMAETTLAQVASRSSTQRSGHRASRVYARRVDRDPTVTGMRRALSKRTDGRGARTA